MLSNICNKQVVPIITPRYSGSIEVIISTEVVTAVEVIAAVELVEVVDVIKVVMAAKIIRWINFSRSKP